MKPLTEAITCRRRRACAVCDDPQRSGAPVPCTQCRLVFYCSKAHRRDHASHHRPLCRALHLLHGQLRRQQSGLRGELREFVGLYWGFYEARDLLRTKLELVGVYQKIGTSEALQSALTEAIYLLRLSRADPMAVRYIVPVLLLQLNQVQACYDFLNYSFRDMSMPFLELEGSDLTESVAFVDVLSLPHSLAFVVVKLRVCRIVGEGIQAERVGRIRAIPTPVVRIVHDFLGCQICLPHQSVRETHADVQAQVTEMIKRTRDLNSHVWETIMKPQRQMKDGRVPDGFAAGSKDEARVTLDVWLDVLIATPGLRAAVRESDVLRTSA